MPTAAFASSWMAVESARTCCRSATTAGSAGSAAGGAPFEELVGLVEHGYGDAAYAIVSMLNDGTMHPDVWDVLEPSAIIALRKPNGKPRPIAMGDVLERVGGQCILFTKLADLDKWFTSDEDLRRVLASDEWRAAFVVPRHSFFHSPFWILGTPPFPFLTPLQKRL